MFGVFGLFRGSSSAAPGRPKLDVGRSKTAQLSVVREKGYWSGEMLCRRSHSKWQASRKETKSTNAFRLLFRCSDWLFSYLIVWTRCRWQARARCTWPSRMRARRSGHPRDLDIGLRKSHCRLSISKGRILQSESRILVKITSGRHVSHRGRRMWCRYLHMCSTETRPASLCSNSFKGLKVSQNLDSVLGRNPPSGFITR